MQMSVINTWAIYSSTHYLFPSHTHTHMHRFSQDALQHQALACSGFWAQSTYVIFLTGRLHLKHFYSLLFWLLLPQMFNTGFTPKTQTSSLNQCQISASQHASWAADWL